MRLAIVLSFLLLAPALPFAGASVPEPCLVPHWLPGVQQVDGGVGEYVRVTFRVDTPTTGTFWAAVAWHVATTFWAPVSYGFSSERAAAVDFLERADGALVGSPGGMLMYPYGIQLALGSELVRVSEQDGDVCGGAAAGTEHALAPGTYTYTVLGGGDTPNGAAAMLPLGVSIVEVETGPARVVSEASLSCTAKAHAMALGFTSAALTGCSETFHPTGRAYHGVFSGRFPDATHNVRWDPSVGATRAVAFFDGGVEPAGDARLLVPTYVTPAGDPLWSPLPTPGALGSDSGVFGVFADV